MEDDILIDNYLKGLLSKDETESFLERLDSDAEFKENFELEEQLFNVLDENSWNFIDKKASEVEEYKKLLQQDDLQNLKKTLANTNTEFNSNSRKSKPTKRLFFYLAAASIIVFLGFQFFFNKDMSNQEMYNDYINLNDLPSFVSRSENSNKLTEAQDLFENKKYEEALTIFNSIKEAQQHKGALMIYKGISETELGKYKEAENTFNNLINSGLLDAEKGYWYKALVLLKADSLVDSKSILEKIVTENLYKNREAKALLEKIKH